MPYDAKTLLALLSHHLPRIRPLDTGAGAAAGAGLGALTYLFRRLASDKAQRKQLSLTKHLLTGAAAGAAGGNVIGDRLRRYVANTVAPWGYAANRKFIGTPSQIYQAAILDKPVYPLVADNNADGPARLQTWNNEARYELFRRALGLPAPFGKTPIFRDIGPQPYFPTETGGGVEGTFRTVELNKPRWDTLMADEWAADDFKASMQQGADDLQAGKPANGGYEFWRRTLARHDFNPRDFFTKTDGSRVPAQTVSDLWDFALTPTEERLLRFYARTGLTRPAALRSPAPWYPDLLARGKIDSVNGVQTAVGIGQNYKDIPSTDLSSQGEHFMALAQRKFLNDVLAYGGGVKFHQSFDAAHQPLYTAAPTLQHNDFANRVLFPAAAATAGTYGAVKGLGMLRTALPTFRRKPKTQR